MKALDLLLPDMPKRARRDFAQHMRTPILACVMLLVMLGVIVLLGACLPFRNAWMIEAATAVGMVLTVLLLSMEIGREPALHRFYAGIGFFWVGILISMTLIDYLNR
jgi:cytochrome c oxidase subunit 4